MPDSLLFHFNKFLRTIPRFGGKPENVNTAAHLVSDIIFAIPLNPVIIGGLCFVNQRSHPLPQDIEDFKFYLAGFGQLVFDMGNRVKKIRVVLQ
ncbi:MAG TPA: hypothetical protein ENK14_11680 [Caldithrix sp.]|nr:hypothetical protein [Caldithrix sp.]